MGHQVDQLHGHQIGVEAIGEVPPALEAEVIAMLFSFFAVPALYQHRVLYYGILGALVLRAVFIAAGSLLLQYHWVVVLFGGLLVLTAVKMVVTPEMTVDPSRNRMIRLLRRLVPVTPGLHGQRFFVRLGPRLHATPLLVALVFLGGSNPVLTYQISNMVTSKGSGWQLLTAAAFISMALPMIVFFALQRYFVRGLLAGSIKG